MSGPEKTNFFSISPRTQVFSDFIYPKKVLNARVLHMFAILTHIVFNMCKSKAHKLLNVTNVDGLVVNLKLDKSTVASVSS